MDDADEILGGASAFGLRAAAWKHVLSDMTLEDVCHQAVHRAACRRDQSQHLAAISFSGQRAPECFDLPTNASDPVSQLFLVADGVSHVDQYSRGATAGSRGDYMVFLADQCAFVVDTHYRRARQ